MTNVNEVQCRSRYFVQYFSRVVQDPQIISSDEFHLAISSPPKFAEVMKRAASGIAVQKRLTKEQQQVEAQFPKAVQTRACSQFDHSQHFLRNGNPILSFPGEVQFILHGTRTFPGLF